VAGLDVLSFLFGLHGDSGSQFEWLGERDVQRLQDITYEMSSALPGWRNKRLNHSDLAAARSFKFVECVGHLSRCIILASHVVLSL
jgi:hypothetical protein